MPMIERLTSWFTAPRERPRIDPRLPEMLVSVALAELGRGEEGGDNRGPDIDRYRLATGKPGGRGAWCGAFASWVVAEAAYRCGRVSPITGSRGAKALVRQAAAAGQALTVPERGALLAWHRTDPVTGMITWRGHVAIVERYDAASDTVHTIEGNKRRKGERWAHVAQFDYPVGVWRRKLAGLAILR